MNNFFAAILLFSSPGCPHDEPLCITPTEYVEVDLSIAQRHPLRPSGLPILFSNRHGLTK